MQNKRKKESEEPLNYSTYAKKLVKYHGFNETVTRFLRHRFAIDPKFWKEVETPDESLDLDDLSQCLDHSAFFPREKKVKIVDLKCDPDDLKFVVVEASNEKFISHRDLLKCIDECMPSDGDNRYFEKFKYIGLDRDDVLPVLFIQATS